MLVQADFIPYGHGAVLERRLGGSRALHTVTEPCGSPVRVASLRAPSLSTTSIVVHTFTHSTLCSLAGNPTSVLKRTDHNSVFSHSILHITNIVWNLFNIIVVILLRLYGSFNHF